MLDGRKRALPGLDAVGDGAQAGGDAGSRAAGLGGQLRQVLEAVGLQALLAELGEDAGGVVVAGVIDHGLSPSLTGHIET
jgi:hypothetical protein